MCLQLLNLDCYKEKPYRSQLMHFAPFVVLYFGFNDARLEFQSIVNNYNDYLNRTVNYENGPKGGAKRARVSDK